MIVVTAALAVSAAAVGGGLRLAGDDPDEPHGGDAHTAAPGCGLVPEEAIAGALPGAVLESAESGPLAGGESTECVWTSAGRIDGADGGEANGNGEQGVLRVELSARFTDASAEPVVTGEEFAARAQSAVVPMRGETVVLAPGAEGADGGGDAAAGEGIEAEVWRGQVPGTAELAFHEDNLLVRVSYSAMDGDDPVPFDRARETVMDFAGQLGEAL
ncbi:hypothetical protein [Nocardiopsis metallicus]|uniref:DUF3558 domain-containing protein n=1 Tax=Nocardiopsis metallicus TaxID=179819 RepID=A0A840W7Q9_9ACTN|nr:hypothetical protein [Nocardiopsis metallicus]MBB5492074.1 hypothetical protein [Nocardiopsis metallicus]